MLLLAGLLLTLAPSSDTLFVDFDDPNGLPTVQAAIDAASSGDTIVVLEPAFDLSLPIRPGFAIDGKGLTIIGIQPQDADDLVRLRPCQITNVPAGQTVTLRNFEFGRHTTQQQPHGLQVSYSPGAVRLESCRVLSGSGWSSPTTASLDLRFALDVGLVDCSLEGNANGAIRAWSSRVALYSCDVTGGEGSHSSSYTHAIAADGTTAIQLMNRSFAWIGMSTVTGGEGGYAECIHGAPCITESGDGGDGLHVEPGSLAVTLSSSIVGGEPGVSSGFAAGSSVGSAGTDVLGTAVLVPGSHRDLVAPATVDSGEPVTIEVEGLPGENVFLITGTGSGHRFLGPLNGVLLVNDGLLGAPLDLGTIPASGRLTASITLPPEVDEGVTTYTLQAFCRTSPTRFRLTPPARVSVLGDNTPFLETPEVLYLNPAAPPGGRGRNWQHAARNLSDALKSLPRTGSDPVEVWLARGAYTPAPSAAPLDRTSLQIKRSVTMIGGFVGNESTLAERDPLSFSTLTGDLLGDDRLPSGSRDENARGLIYANLPYQQARVGLVGMRLLGSEQYAAAIITATTVEIDRCEFVSNYGGSLSPGGLALINQLVGENRAVLRSTRFIDNYGGRGGAVYSDTTHAQGVVDRLEVVNCEFIGNGSDHWEFMGTTNSRAMVGGAIFNAELSSTRLVNCTFLDNESPREAGTNEVAFGGLFAERAHFDVYNCVFANTLSEAGLVPIYPSLGPAAGGVIEHCASAWTDPSWSASNMAVSPGYLDIFGPDGIRASGDEDLRLSSDSPGIDAGDDTALTATITLDINGMPRRVDDPAAAGSALIDLGAHERQ